MTTTSPHTFDDRLDRLRERKLAQTREKLALRGPMDEDDYGTIVPPDGFLWQPVGNHPNGSFYGAQGWGDNFRSLMEAYPVYIDPDDAIAGRIVLFLHRIRKGPGWRPEFDYDHLKPYFMEYNIHSGINASSHFGPDYALGLSLGFGGLLAKIRHYRALHGPEHAEFYDAEENTVLGIQSWVRRHAEVAADLAANESDPARRDDLRRIAEVNAWLVDGAPRTFHEACQWIAWFGMAARTFNRDGAGCQIDTVLLAYYEADVAAGRLTDDEAVFTLACLFLNDTHYNQISGVSPDGHDLTNPLSFLALEAAQRLRVPVNLTVRVHDGMDARLLDEAVRGIFRYRTACPRFAGERGLTEGFMRNGYPAELARQRACVGCHWTSLPGREYTFNDTVKINAARVFEVAFWELLDATDAPTVAALWDRFAHHLGVAVEVTKQALDFHLAHAWDNEPELVLNLCCHGPIERGRDITDGGVEFYNLCIDGCGLATVADSFAAVETRVEREGRLSWAELADHLRADFAGPTGERARLMLKSCGRYGAGNAPGDDWAVRVSRLFTEQVKSAPTPGGRLCIPGWFSWSSTIGMGKRVGATPNGRKAQAPISHGANPDPGFRRDGAPTAMAQAIARIQPGYGNTAPMQLELDPGAGVDDAGIARVIELIRTHFALGGTLINLNILDADTLHAAHRDPTAHPDLVVRVTGFTAYFAALSPEFRQLVVDRIVQGM